MLLQFIIIEALNKHLPEDKIQGTFEEIDSNQSELYDIDNDKVTS